MTFAGAVIKEQGVTFAIVIIKKAVFDVPQDRSEAAVGFQFYFPGLPLILMSQDHVGTPMYWGRTDIVSFLAGIPLRNIPWRKYTKT